MRGANGNDEALADRCKKLRRIIISPGVGARKARGRVHADGYYIAEPTAARVGKEAHLDLQRPKHDGDQTCRITSASRTPTRCRSRQATATLSKSPDLAAPSTLPVSSASTSPAGWAPTPASRWKLRSRRSMRLSPRSGPLLKI